MRRPWAAACVLSLALAPAAAACKRGHAAAAAADSGDAPIVVRENSQGLLLTWIDDKGDFHVETRVGDVPMMGRDAVRVVDPGRDDGAHAERVLLADLRQPGPDGAFPVRIATRAEFEALAVARREKTGPTLASAAPASSTSAPPARSTGEAKPAAAARALVVIYGAEWCGACHDAARYLRSKGIAYVEKDVEKDPAAAREMSGKLAKNGLRAGSIPVIDVRGRVMIGFDARAVEAALGEAL